MSNSWIVALFIMLFLLIMNPNNMDVLLVLYIIFIIVHFFMSSDDNKEKKPDEKKVSDDKAKKKELEDKQYKENLQTFLEEAKIKYCTVRKEHGFSDNDYLENSPYEVCGVNDGYKVMLKWEVYENEITHNTQKYRSDIIAKKSGSIVNIDVFVKEFGYDTNFVDWENPSEHIYTTLKKYTSIYQNRTEEKAKEFKNAEMEVRKKLHSHY